MIKRNIFGGKYSPFRSYLGTSHMSVAKEIGVTNIILRMDFEKGIALCA